MWPYQGPPLRKAYTFRSTQLIYCIRRGSASIAICRCTSSEVRSKTGHPIIVRNLSECMTSHKHKPVKCRRDPGSHWCSHLFVLQLFVWHYLTVTTSNCEILLCVIYGTSNIWMTHLFLSSKFSIFHMIVHISHVLVLLTSGDTMFLPTARSSNWLNGIPSFILISQCVINPVQSTIFLVLIFVMNTPVD